MSSPLRISQHLDDNKEIDRYLRCMTIKSAQFVVNSRCPRQRSSRKSITRSSSEHWFNLSIAENSILLEEIKQLYEGKQLDLGQPFCIKIYLRTNEDETMLVEQWWFKKTLLSTPSTNSSKSLLYSNLTTLLKSLIVMTTSLPGNSLSKRQTSSSYLLHYKLKVGEPIVDLSDNFKEHSLGSVSILGVQFSLHVAWKTKLQFAPRKRYEITNELSEDHFESSSPRSKTIPQVSSPSLHPDSVDSPALTKAAFRLTPPDDDSDDDMPFGRLLKLATTPSPPCTPPTFGLHHRHRNLSEVDNGVILEGSDQEDEEGDKYETSKSPTHRSSQTLTSSTSKASFKPSEPLRATFATHFNDIKQLSAFSEEIPELEMFKDEEGGEDGVEDLVQQFMRLEAAKDEVLEFVKMINDVDDDINIYG